MEPAIINFAEMFERSINLLKPWHVTKAEFNQAQRAVHVYVEGQKTAKYPCPECGKACRRYDEEDEEREWRHADVVLYPCYIHCRRPRVKCEEHGIQVVDAPWARRYARCTLGFEGYAMLLAENMSLNEACRLLRMSRTALLTWGPPYEKREGPPCYDPFAAGKRSQSDQRRVADSINFGMSFCQFFIP